MPDEQQPSSSPQVPSEQAPSASPPPGAEGVGPVESASADAVSTPEQQPSPSFLDRLASKGYDTSGFESEDAALESLLEGAQSWNRNQPAIAYYQQHAADFEQFLKSKQTSAATGPPEEKPAETPQPDEFKWELPPAPDPRALQLLEEDPQTGRFKPPDNMPYLADEARKANEYLQARQQQSDKLLSQFPDLTVQAFEAKTGIKVSDVKALADEVKQLREWRDTYEQRQAEQAREAFVREHEKEWFLHDEKDQPVRDPKTGEWIKTPKGESVARHLQRLQLPRDQGGYGMDEQSAWDIAVQLADAEEAKGAIPRSQGKVRPRGPDGRYLKEEPSHTEPGQRFIDRVRQPEQSEETPPPENGRGVKSRLTDHFAAAAKEHGILPD